MYDNTIFILLLIAVVILYMLPTLVAYARDDVSRGKITVLNIILGWTAIGWLVIFLWALLARTEEEPA